MNKMNLHQKELVLNILLRAVKDYNENPNHRGAIMRFFKSELCKFYCNCIDDDITPEVLMEQLKRKECV